MTSSPYNPKKAKASLTYNISNFFEHGESLPVDNNDNYSTKNIHLEGFDTQSEKLLKSPVSEGNIFTSQNVTPDLNESKNIMNEIPLFNILGNSLKKKGPLNNISHFGFSERQTFIIGELPQQFYFSKCFQTFDAHNSDNLVLLNLYDTVKIMKLAEKKVLISRLLSSETFLSAIAVGKINLDGYYITSDFSNQISVYDIEGNKRLRNYNVSKPTRSFASKICQEHLNLFCGFSNGVIRGFDFRMKTNSHYLCDNLSHQEIQKKDSGIFNPITSLEIRDNYLLTTSLNKLCLWDLRKNLLVSKVEGVFADGVLKGLFSPNNDHQCYLGCRREKKLEIVDLISGKVQILFSEKRPIHDFGFNKEVNKLLILTGEENKNQETLICENENKKKLNKTDELSAKESLTDLGICNVAQDNTLSNMKRVEMSKNFENLLINQNGTKAWIFGILFLLFKFIY